MELDSTVARLKELISQREAIDEELKKILGGEAPRRTLTCSRCGEQGHTARGCPQKVPE